MITSLIAIFFIWWLLNNWQFLTSIFESTIRSRRAIVINSPNNAPCHTTCQCHQQFHAYCKCHMQTHQEKSSHCLCDPAPPRWNSESWIYPCCVAVYSLSQQFHYDIIEGVELGLIALLCTRVLNVHKPVRWCRSSLAPYLSMRIQTKRLPPRFRTIWKYN